MGLGILDEPIMVSESEWLSNSFRIYDILCHKHVLFKNSVLFATLKILGHITCIS